MWAQWALGTGVGTRGKVSLDPTVRIGTKRRKRLDVLLHAFGIGAYVCGWRGKRNRQEEDAKENDGLA